MEENISSDNSKHSAVKSTRAQNREVGYPERGILMPSENYAAELYGQAKSKDDFISFLRFCSEHLEKGETVQAIWHGYQEIAAQISK